MARYFFIVIFSFFVKGLFADPPIDTAEYLERCRKFSVPLSSILCTDLENIPPAFKECGLDPDKIMIINVESILNGAFTDKPERIFYYHELLESEEKLREAFRNILLCHAPVVLEEGEKMEDAQARAETYHQFIFDTISNGFGFRKHRERIVSFLAALEYRQSLDSQFKIHLTRDDKFEEKDYGNYLILGLELKDGRHYSDSIPETHCNFTLPLTEATPIFSSGLAITNSISDDIYACSHEIGHAIHDLLGISARRIPFTIMADNVFMRNTFFPILDRGEKSLAYLIAEMKIEIDKKIESEEISNAFDYFVSALEMVKEPYREERWPSDAEEFNRMGITKLEKILQTESIQQALKENSIGDDLFVQLIMLCVRYIAFYECWTTAEELFQITGAVAANDHIIVDTISDLDWLWNQKRLVRWLHSSMNNIEKPQDGPAINLALERKYADLFFLHGLGI